ncbi:MAG: IS1634 family transposase, partial [Mycobacterium sp.]|nr:IS1634 family transposase [Mycobacterium sp.]
YEHIGFAEVVGEDEAFRQLVLARIIEPTSKADSLRVIEETGVAPVSYLNAVIDPERRVDWQARRADRRGADRRRADRDELELRVFET